MSSIITDLSVNKNWILRIGDNNEFTITFLNNGSPFNISSYTFFGLIRKFGSTTNLVSLTQDSGLTNNGAAGTLNVQVTKTNSELLVPSEYYFEIYYTIAGIENTLLHGTQIATREINPDAYDGSITVNVNLSGTELTLNVSLAGGSELQISSTTTTSTLTPDPSYDCFELTAQSGALTIANPSTDYGNFEIFMIRITPSNANALTFGSKYRGSGSALPTITTISKVMVITCLYDSNEDKYDVKYSEEV